MCHAQFRVYTLRFSFPLKELLSKIAENYYENIHDTATFFKNGYDSWYFFLNFLQTFYLLEQQNWFSMFCKNP